MRTIVVGFGVQGKKRAKFAGDELVGIVDPVHPDADFLKLEDVPLESFDAALLCTPDEVKLDLVKYLLTNSKHVLLEKPFLLNSSVEFKNLEILAKEKKLACYTAYNHRFEPHIVNLKATLEDGLLGHIYLVRMLYGNGTARDVRNSEWRDKGLGVLPDIGSHLLDTILFLFGEPKKKFNLVHANCFENKAPDYIMFSSNSSDCTYQLEATLLSWRNTFRMDVIGELGSAHINCLCKWGPSTFTVRKRILPSGKPEEETETIECADPTWELEYNYFKTLCQNVGTNLKNDAWISDVLNSMNTQYAQGQ